MLAQRLARTSCPENYSEPTVFAEFPAGIPLMTTLFSGLGEAWVPICVGKIHRPAF